MKEWSKGEKLCASKIIRRAHSDRSLLGAFARAAISLCPKEFRSVAVDAFRSGSSAPQILSVCAALLSKLDVPTALFDTELGGRMVKPLSVKGELIAAMRLIENSSAEWVDKVIDRLIADASDLAVSQSVIEERWSSGLVRMAVQSKERVLSDDALSLLLLDDLRIAEPPAPVEPDPEPLPDDVSVMIDPAGLEEEAERLELLREQERLQREEMEKMKASVDPAIDNPDLIGSW